MYPAEKQVQICEFPQKCKSFGVSACPCIYITWQACNICAAGKRAIRVGDYAARGADVEVQLCVHVGVGVLAVCRMWAAWTVGWDGGQEHSKEGGSGLWAYRYLSITTSFTNAVGISPWTAAPPVKAGSLASVLLPIPHLIFSPHISRPASNQRFTPSSAANKMLYHISNKSTYPHIIPSVQPT